MADPSAAAPLTALRSALTSLPALLDTHHAQLMRALEGGGAGAEQKKKCENIHKQWHTALARVEKEIDKEKIWKSDIATAAEATREAFKGKKSHIDKAIAHHFVRESMFDIANTFSREAQLSHDHELENNFKALFEITQDLQSHKIDSALNWVNAQKSKANAKTAHLKFSLHKLQFLISLQKGDRNAALEYARTHFVEFSAFANEIKMATMMKDKRLSWSEQNEMPVEIPLPRNLQYHSVFACPVSRELATEENPPMMLPCGHVICRGSLDKLSKGTKTARLKCPYCPQDCVPASAMRVRF